MYNSEANSIFIQLYSMQYNEALISFLPLCWNLVLILTPCMFLYPHPCHSCAIDNQAALLPNVCSRECRQRAGLGHTGERLRFSATLCQVPKEDDWETSVSPQNPMPPVWASWKRHCWALLSQARHLKVNYLWFEPSAFEKVCCTQQQISITFYPNILLNFLK